MAQSIKRLQISKANAKMVMVVAACSVIVTFSLVASAALWSQRNYQSRVIKAKKAANDQLTENIAATEKLANSYKQFVGTSDNVIGGNPKGTGSQDGDNAKIVLDALPSKYDFPALTSSLEKLLSSGSYQIGDITGTDDEVNQAAQANAEAKAIEIPFTVSVKGSYASMKDLLSSFDRSIRPMHIQTISLSGTDSQITADVTAITYYQPGKTLKIDSQVVK